MGQAPSQPCTCGFAECWLPSYHHLVIHGIASRLNPIRFHSIRFKFISFLFLIGIARTATLDNASASLCSQRGRRRDRLRQCATCLVPRKESWLIHLRAAPHRMTGNELRLTMDHVCSYTGLHSFAELRQRAQDRSTQAQPCRSIDGLEIYSGYTCICTDGECHYSTRRLQSMRVHVTTHGKKAKTHSDTTPLWRACLVKCVPGVFTKTNPAGHLGSDADFGNSRGRWDENREWPTKRSAALIDFAGRSVENPKLRKAPHAHSGASAGLASSLVVPVICYDSTVTGLG